MALHICNNVRVLCIGGSLIGASIEIKKVRERAREKVRNIESERETETERERSKGISCTFADIQSNILHQ
jgi:hypothetical protein